jgi:hypothetical protein
MAVVIDDHLLVDLLADNTSDWLRGEVDRSAVYTTAAWYYRVARAARRGSGTGTLSGRLARLDPAQRDEALARIDRLPDWIGLVGPRLLIPVMASLETRRRPNVLTAEALALALVTDSTIIVTVNSPLLREGARDLGITYREMT